MTERLSNKVAVVTGGAQGIGQAIAKRLQDAGATVVIGDRQQPTNSSIEILELDVTRGESVQRFVSNVVAAHNGIDILVNNAGIMFERPIDEQTEKEWDAAMAVNVKGPFLMTKYCAPHMAKREGGSIINIGSIEGFITNPNHTAYAASKGAVHGLTVATAVDLGPQGIRCNAIAPGWIDTELNRTFMEKHPDRELMVEELARLHPVGHIGAPSDIGDVAVWLASNESRFVSGEVITVDGARTRKASLPSLMQ